MKAPFSFLFLCFFFLSCTYPTHHTSDFLTATASDHQPMALDTTGTLNSTCPADMVEVKGTFCPNLETECLYNVDRDGNPQIKYDSRGKPLPGDLLYSCGEYKNPTVCKSSAKDLVNYHFCIDKYEYPNHEGEKPQDWMTYLQAKKIAASLGKRLCTAREWTLAAEGPNRHPLPYGDGYHRDSHICNIDRKYSEVEETDQFKDLGLKGIDVFQAKSPTDAMSQALRLFLVPSGSMPDCHSDYGVYDMAGNIDELVTNEGGSSCLTHSTGNCISGLKGGHVWHVRNASRPMTTAHGEGFGWYETGTRMCKDIQ